MPRQGSSRFEMQGDDAPRRVFRWRTLQRRIVEETLQPEGPVADKEVWMAGVWRIRISFEQW